MKPIILNMNEMSDSKEVYNSRPNPFFSIFIYFVLIMLITALIWLYFGQIDVVIKAGGVVRPNAQVGTVINAVAGEVEKINYTDGKQVKKGDILYIINYSKEESEKSVLSETISQKEHELKVLSLYIDSINAEENLIKDFDIEYGVKFDSFLINLRAMELNLGSEDKRLLRELKDLEASLLKNEKELKMYITLKDSVIAGKNLFEGGAEQEIYKNMFHKYMADMENAKISYDKQEQDIKNDMTKESARNLMTFYENAIKGHTLLKDSIEKDTDLFFGNDFEDDVCKNKYEDYLLKINQLEENLASAESFLYEQTILFETDFVSENDYEEAKKAAKRAESAITEYRLAYLLDINVSLEDLQAKQNDAALILNSPYGKEDLLLINSAQKDYYLKKYELDTIVTTEAKITQLEETIEKTKNQITQTNLAIDGKYISDGVFSNVAVFKLNELNQAVNQKKIVQNELLQLNLSLEKTEKQIEYSIVKAQIDGKINITTEFTEGDYLPGGTNVMTIIPERDSRLNANIFVSNKDIAKLERDMSVKYNIHAMPQQDYGVITGRITNISEDLKIDNNNSQGYYLVESEIQDRVYYDAKGNKASLRVGMSFDAQIVVERKKILFYLLEKIDLWD